ncbi:SapC family protein [Thermomonas carbonis]|uniref:SapC family protein n=1 Tax=Thermomonas carbonis TaxID=1463158 RepID=A0A7G9SSL5_9GAMM|nr:SapC family protein [Thermomonas carbonis]QNN70840.1 SapC family protein [Thermomonas carbonis]GHC02772.1 peptidase [Thermomonas carbonis]
MARHVQLNNIDHRDLRIDTRRGAALGDDVAFVATFPAEFRDLQAHYPIVFRKDAQGVLSPVALLGFQEGHNLFLDGECWDAAYLPLGIERHPFLIGRGGDDVTVHVDLDSPRVRSDAGEALFREHGGNTDYLDRVASVLLTLHNGLQRVPAFVDALLARDLLESFVLDVELDDGSVNRLTGYYTINEERLRALDAMALGELHAAGHLEPVFMAVASVSNFRGLIDRMNRSRAGGR